MTAPSDSGIPRFLTIEEACELMGVKSENTLRSFLRRREKETGQKIITNLGSEKREKLRITRHSLYTAAEEAFPGRAELGHRLDRVESKVEVLEKGQDVLADDLDRRRRALANISRSRSG